MNLTALRASARRKLSFQAGSTKYPDADLDANLNEWYRLCVAWACGASGIWEYQGDVITTSLVQDQIEYVLPASAIQINRVEVLYPNATDYVVADRVDDKQLTDSAFANNEISFGSTGKPAFRIFDQSIFIYPAPTAAVVNGLKVEVVEDVSDLSSGSDVPNINSLMHRILATGAAYDYAVTHDFARKADRFYREIYGRSGYESDPSSLKYQFEVLVSMRDRSTRRRIVPRRRSYK